VIIHSFDDVLRAPKSIHSIELTPGGNKIPMWRPIPWIGIFYFVIVEIVFIVAARVPVLDVLSELFAPLVYYVVFPIAVVWVALNVELDGRSPHRWVASYLAFLARPRRTLAGRPYPAPGSRIVCAGRMRLSWDLNAPRLHRGWVKGGTVGTNVGTRFTHALRHRHPVLKPDDRRVPMSGYEVARRLQVRA